MREYCEGKRRKTYSKHFEELLLRNDETFELLLVFDDGFREGLQRREVGLSDDSGKLDKV